jgi:hypothetical protein
MLEERQLITTGFAILGKMQKPSRIILTPKVPNGHILQVISLHYESHLNSDM